MKSMKPVKWFFICLGVVFAVGLFFVFTEETWSTTVELQRESLQEQDGQYYIEVDGRRLSLDDKFLKQLDFEKYTLYKVTYSFNSVLDSADEGVVESIERYGEGAFK